MTCYVHLHLVASPALFPTSDAGEEVPVQLQRKFYNVFTDRPHFDESHVCQERVAYFLTRSEPISWFRAVHKSP